MTQFYVYLSIVLAGFALCIDWVKVFWSSMNRLITWLADGTERVLFVIVVLPANYLAQYNNPPGRHRRNNARQPSDSEVDRWRGADDEFAQILHTMNMSWHINDQARA